MWVNNQKPEQFRYMCEKDPKLKFRKNPDVEPIILLITCVTNFLQKVNQVELSYDGITVVPSKYTLKSPANNAR